MNGTRVNKAEFEAVVGKNTFTLPTADLESGMYVIEILQGESRYVDRFMKE